MTNPDPASTSFFSCVFSSPHDGLGSGSGPTFACTLTPTIGWSTHT
jgi:hypothetical protein